MRALLTVLFAGLLLAAPAGAALAQDRPHTVTGARKGDVEIRAARDEARRTLPDFWRRLEADPQLRERASLKVEFVKGENSEAMWVGQLRRGPDGRIMGVLNNKPVMVTNVKQGDAVTVDPDLIMDWTYHRGGRAWGHYTTRVLLKRMPAEQRAQYDGYFSDTAVEP